MTVRIGVLTSGGDAQGMNAAVRAVVRTALAADAEVYGILEGWQGAVDGGDYIRPLGWDDVSGITALGGTVIGTARCAAFRTAEGRRTAVAHLIEKGIDRLIVIGGDGSLTGTDALRAEWPDHVAALLASGAITPEQAERHHSLVIAGLVGSIDNDMVGTDMTIGTDSALHRIVEAIDAIASTAASHQRSFVVEVMGRHCGYLALMAAIAGGADYVFIPEQPPSADWHAHMASVLRRARNAGRRTSIVVVAEGAADADGNPITAEHVRAVLSDEMGEDARVTILGHVQRGGTPSAYDRWMASMIGHAAVEQVLGDASEAQVVGVRANRPHAQPLVEAVAATRNIATLIAEKRFDEAMAARGHSFVQMHAAFRRLSEARTAVETPDPDKRVAIMHVGGLAPGMNAAAKALVRLGVDHGFTMLGVQGGFPGLIAGDVRELRWGDVEGWTSTGGANLGTRRWIPGEEELYGLARSVETLGIDGIVIVGGFNAYRALTLLQEEKKRYPSLNIPTVVLPASIDNNLPGLQMAIGADTALNVAVQAVDRIKLSASAAKRAFVVETMGRHCGFLALATGVAGGAERVYLNEDGLSIGALAADIDAMVAAFSGGQSFWLAIRNEEASAFYTTDLLTRMFEAEGHGLYSVRGVVLGHVQQGGTPSPFDRINGVRLAAAVTDWMNEKLATGEGIQAFATPDGIRPVKELDDLVDWEVRRPLEQWWLVLKPVLAALGHRPGSDVANT
ncbi:6-phosphofructokinase [Propioniciclava sinopodophylli]|uniref:6-phosphofructokinase n=1 Tax=Propioniciclava sinopodophylli TaxID=1837344 RepID=A0A4V2JSQ0_9ACTN|nr:6-phosphofructokinase [Propioniciclava sinopodophylli]TBT87337.1 6-phosphofructokinase [Propioniciclava sinopodophylli]